MSAISHDELSAIEQRITETGLLLTHDEAKRLITMTRRLMSAEFWNKFVYPDGALAQDIQNELSDYKFLLEQVSLVYCHVTGGLLSKTNYFASEVISAMDRFVEHMIDEALNEARDEWDEEQKACMSKLTLDD